MYGLTVLNNFKVQSDFVNVNNFNVTQPKLFSKKKYF